MSPIAINNIPVCPYIDIGNPVCPVVLSLSKAICPIIDIHFSICPIIGVGFLLCPIFDISISKENKLKSYSVFRLFCTEGLIIGHGELSFKDMDGFVVVDPPNIFTIILLFDLYLP